MFTNFENIDFMGNEFCYFLRVRYFECDAQKVVFNGRYSDYVDLAAGEYMRAVWGDYSEMLSQGMDNQVVSYTINWKGPAHFDDVLAVTVVPSRIGNSSFTFKVDFYRYGSDDLIASSEIVYVMVSANEHKKMAIPQAMREKLECGAGGVVVNHAGVTI